MRRIDSIPDASSSTALGSACSPARVGQFCPPVRADSGPIAKGPETRALLILSVPSALLGCSLRPPLRGIFPSCSARRLRSRIHCRLRNPDGLLHCGRRQRGFRSFVRRDCVFIRQQRRDYSQRLHFFLQAGQFQFLLTQNLVNIFHRVVHLCRNIGTLGVCLLFVKKFPARGTLSLTRVRKLCGRSLSGLEEEYK